MDRLRRPLRSLRFRIPATAVAVFAISLAVASVLAYELFLQDGRRDIDVVIAREQERFERSMTTLLADQRATNRTPTRGRPCARPSAATSSSTPAPPRTGPS
jgi:hypothetical protein